MGIKMDLFENKNPKLSATSYIYIKECGSVQVLHWVITAIQLKRVTLLLYDKLVITGHSVINNLSPCCGDAIITVNSIVYLKNMEILIQNMPVQHLSLT